MSSDPKSSAKCAPMQGAGEAGAFGLVPYTTTDTVGFQDSRLSLSLDFLRLRRLKHHIRTAGRLHREDLLESKRRWHCALTTLTYAPGPNPLCSPWRPEHLSQFLKAVREWARRRGFSLRYVWCAETQQNGMIHYHVVWYLPLGVRLPKPDKRGWWKHGMSNNKGVKSSAVGYLMKYVSKGVGDKPLPHGARVCGSGGLSDRSKKEFHYWRTPLDVRKHMVIGDKAKRVEGGGWCVEHHLDEKRTLIPSLWWPSSFQRFDQDGKPTASKCLGGQRVMWLRPKPDWAVGVLPDRTDFDEVNQRYCAAMDHEQQAFNALRESEGSFAALQVIVPELIDQPSFVLMRAA